MTDDVIEQVTSCHLLEPVSQSVSTDGLTVMLVFMVGGENGPRRFAITFPIDMTTKLIGMLHEVARSIAAPGTASKLLLNFPLQWGVHTAPELDSQAFKLADDKTEMGVGGKIIISFDAQNFVIMNVPAIQLARAIDHHAMPKLTDAERVQLAQAAKPAKVQ